MDNSKLYKSDFKKHRYFNKFDLLVSIVWFIVTYKLLNNMNVFDEKVTNTNLFILGSYFLLSYLVRIFVFRPMNNRFDIILNKIRRIQKEEGKYRFMGYVGKSDYLYLELDDLKKSFKGYEPDNRSKQELEERINQIRKELSID